MASEHWNEYQRNYNKTHYKSVSALLEPELVNKFKKKLNEDNISIVEFIKNAIEKYLKG
jgi:phosphoglucomutase